MWKGIWALGFLIICGCGDGAAGKVQAIVDDKSKTDEQAISEIAKMVWPKTILRDLEVKVEKSSDGKYRASIISIYKSEITISTSKEQLRATEYMGMSKFIWRMLRAGQQRNLDEVLLTQRITVKVDGKTELLDLFTVRLKLAKLKSLSGWDKADPYDVGEFDILNPAGQAVTDQISAAWKVEKDNLDSLKY